MVRNLLILTLGMGLLAVTPRSLIAQEEAKAPETPKAEETAKPQPAAAPELNPADVQWVWGEVLSVDPAVKNVVVKYLDYDTDEEKTMTLTVTDTSTFQEITGIEAIKPQDTVSIEYISRDGKNLVKDITVEQVEDAAAGAEQQPPQIAPEKVGSGPVSETEGPAQPQQGK